MAVDPEFLDHLRDLFAGLGPIRTGRMFSGAGLYVEDDVMFAMISSAGILFMKSDATTEHAFLEAGSTPFSYERGGRTQAIHSLMSLPESALDDPDEALHWARLSLPPARIATAAKRQQKVRKKARKT